MTEIFSPSTYIIPLFCQNFIIQKRKKLFIVGNYESGSLEDDLILPDEAGIVIKIYVKFSSSREHFQPVQNKKNLRLHKYDNNTDH